MPLPGCGSRCSSRPGGLPCAAGMRVVRSPCRPRSPSGCHSRWQSVRAGAASWRWRVSGEGPQSPPAARIAAWMAVGGLLWVVPLGLGWLAGRISRRRRGRPITVVLKSGARIGGTLHHASATEFILADATVETRRYARVTINRCDAELVLGGSHVAGEQPSSDQQSDMPLAVASPPRDDRRTQITSGPAEAVLPTPARRPPP